MRGTPAPRPIRLDVHLLRAPVDRPVRSSLAATTARPCLSVRVEDEDGAFRWGEVWCNVPSCGPEHRARLAETAVGPLVLGQRFADPAEAFAELSRAPHTLALPTSEPGPSAQVVAGLDGALRDLLARRARLPIHRLLGGERSSVAVPASGIDPDLAAETVARARTAGDRPFEPLWLEEPLPADTPWPAWRELARLGLPLAAGENLRGSEAFLAALESRTLAYLQPDLCKGRAGPGGTARLLDPLARAPRRRPSAGPGGPSRARLGPTGTLRARRSGSGSRSPRPRRTGTRPRSRTCCRPRRGTAAESRPPRGNRRRPRRKVAGGTAVRDWRRSSAAAPPFRDGRRRRR
ncbi:MAG: hypothetical protein K6T74_13995 [Geminicoccaceae bacterium]|nr:hypothetical protein [Geminicoccaceae bacterium]